MCSKGTVIRPREVRRPAPPPSSADEPVVMPSPSFLGKSYSFHVFEKPGATAEAEVKAVFRTGSVMSVPRVEIEGIRPLRENFFIMKDRMEMEREGKVAVFDKLTSGGGGPPTAREVQWMSTGRQAR
ncbi:hypothetical protein MLD38_029605 [Melastoma candidum]|uniref:Uncharacterized protein n=1 Tax=Melastoma candidum TaxID=119954 RepID=A0ACB9N9X8_9MYRT|nr:hypothetical protein MLD38_029605 [Melastoma candidum]